MRAPLSVALLATVSLLACRGQKVDKSPVGVVKRLIQYTVQEDTKAAYQLLGPRTRARLQAAARLATDQTGGKRKFAPHEMLSVDRSAATATRWRAKKFVLLEKEGGKARVKVTGEKKDQVVLVQLVRVGGAWRIELPAP